MKVTVDNFEIKVYCYHCDDCDKRFYIEELVDISRYDVHCPHCGSVECVSISSVHLDELNKR